MINYRYRAKAIYVVDGDTIDVIIDLGFNVFNKHRVRLYGIDTPELKSSDLNERVRANEAKALVIDLLTKHPDVEIVTYKDQTDKYGRYLAEVWLPDGTSLANKLIESGYQK
jgi:micrococcal nuclease